MIIPLIFGATFLGAGLLVACFLLLITTDQNTSSKEEERQYERQRKERLEELRKKRAFHREMYPCYEKKEVSQEEDWDAYWAKRGGTKVFLDV